MGNASRFTMFGLAICALAVQLVSAGTVTVDAAANHRPISPLIYGGNFLGADQLGGGKMTLNRYGGNSATRYNYKIDVWNTGADWYFENTAGCFGSAGNWCYPPPSNPQETSVVNNHIQVSNSNGASTIVTVPTLGYVANRAVYSHPFDCGCPKNITANQDSFDPYDTNCGNGKLNGNHITCAPPSYTSIPINPLWSTEWVTYLRLKFGPSNGHRIYALDNEPNLWDSTHYDVHPNATTYDELWEKMRDHAAAILVADPTAAISGPAEWGWPNYFCSAADIQNTGCTATSPDRKNHGGTDLTSWLLQKFHQFQQVTGIRLLHYLDLHYYPQGGSPPENLRSLYDPTYKDPSWINDYINLIPRMHDWVNNNYPGTKIMLSEYSWDNQDTALGAVTYAMVLGIFGREGLDAATMWSPPSATQQAFAAFKLYRNYDGSGAAFESTSCLAYVNGTSNVESYAAVGNTLTLVLVNHGSTAESTTITLKNFAAKGTAQLWTNSGANIARGADITVTNNSATVTLGAMSINMVVFTH